MRDTVSIVRVLVRFLAMVWVLALPAMARAQAERVPFLTEKLRDPDFRVRTNAALALGATNADGAVTPLCGALDDGTEVVRQAAAAGMQRLNRKSALPCLQDHAKLESNETVRGQIARAITALETNGIGGEPPAQQPPPASGSPSENGNAKYYVQIAAVANRTDRPNAEIDALVRRALTERLEAHGAFQLAPKDESIAAAKKAMSKRKLKNGFYLAVSVSANGAGGAQINMSVFTYPSKNLKAAIPAHGSTLEGATGSAAATFEQNVEALL